MIFYKLDNVVFYICLCVFSTLNSLAQDNTKTDFSVFAQYGSWGINITPVLFNKAKTKVEYGTTILNTNPTFHIKAGITKRFLKDKKISLITGVQIIKLPYNNFSFTIEEKDISINEDFKMSDRFLADYYLNIPVLFEHKIKLNNKLFFNSNIGINLFYLSNTYDYTGIGLIDFENETNVQLFMIEQDAKGSNVKISGQLSGGFYFLFDKILFKINLEYNHNFKPLLEGRYKFGNLLETPPTLGEYINSSNYIGVSTTVFLKKRKKK